MEYTEIELMKVLILDYKTYINQIRKLRKDELNRFGVNNFIENGFCWYMDKTYNIDIYHFDFIEKALEISDVRGYICETPNFWCEINKKQIIDSMQKRVTILKQVLKTYQ